MIIKLILTWLLFSAIAVNAQAAVCQPTLAPRASGVQIGDLEFAPQVSDPAYPEGEGPTVVLDEAHHNFHTVNGRYASFVKLLRQDGYIVEPNRGSFNRSVLSESDILVIANALNEQDSKRDWKLPNTSAFDKDEIEAVKQWVFKGGSLFLVADHMPFPGASGDLARAFGVIMTNSFATDETCSADEFLFQKIDQSLSDHVITQGRSADERIDYVRTFTGQAFWVTSPASSLLTLKPGSVLLLPKEAWVFSEETPIIFGDGLLQGAVLEFGKGRVAVFGEAAMFSAQVSGPQRRPMGMNMPNAQQNPQFLLNVMHWLSGLLNE